MPQVPQVQGELHQTSAVSAEEQSISDAARLLASKRGLRQQTQAPPSGQEQQTTQDLGDDGPDGALEDSELSEEELEAGALDSDADASEDLGPEDDQGLVLLDGEQIPLADVRAWREGAMRSDDYQRKTQALSQQQVAIGKMEQELNQFAHGMGRFFQAQMKPVQAVLERYQGVDWQELAKDPAKFNQEQAKFSAAKTRYEGMQKEWQGFLSEYQGLTQRALQMKAQAALPEIRQRVRGWNDAMYAERADFLVSKYGANREVISKVTDPWFWEMANDAFNFKKGSALPGTAKKITQRSPSATPTRGMSPQRVASAQKSMETALTKVSGAKSGVMQTEAAVDVLRARREAQRPVTNQRRRT